MSFQSGCRSTDLNRVMDELKSLRIGYVPCSNSLHHPGDARRFAYYARERNIRYEIVEPDKSYDLVIVTENADISFWSQYKKNKTRVIYDLIDSYLAIPYTNVKGILRGTAKYITGQSKYLRFNHWNTIREMCKRSDAVICSTDEQKEEIQKNNSNVHVILDFHDDVVNAVKSNYESGNTFNLVWEGLPQNVTQLSQLKNILNVLSKKHDIALHVVTDSHYKKYMGRFYNKDTYKVVRQYFDDIFVHEWNSTTLSSIITSCDLGIIPIDLSDRFVSGKPENKLLLMWKMGMPVLVSATPAYSRIMEKAGIRMYCNDDNQWENMLEKYIVNNKEREKAGLTAKKFVGLNFNNSVLLNKWDELIMSVLS